MQDIKILDLFFARSEEAIKQLKEKYGKPVLRMAYNILYDSLDAEECLNDSLLAVWNTIPPKRPDNLGAYFAKIARNISISKYRKKHAEKRNSVYDLSLEELSECIPSTENVERNIELKEITKLIEEYLDSISKENADIFVMRYFLCLSLKEISKRTGHSERNISVKLFRIRNSLREYLIKREGM
ncbi:MAG: sigma-70 family RNA polymerase sigma factor [Eubacteriaceae bacterium]|nr:sigma-70 family RNA polymerase sigma factor [Eubacteriaceae bacterium]